MAVCKSYGLYFRQIASSNKWGMGYFRIAGFILVGKLPGQVYTTTVGWNSLALINDQYTVQ